MKGKAIIFSAPSGAGKTTIVHRLLAELDFLSFSVSATSRPGRGEEKEGKDYYFLTEEAFQEKVDAGAFIEYEEVYPGQSYGTLKQEIDRIWSLNKTVIFDLDVVGGLNLKRYFGENALSIFVMPPNKVELERRLRGRKTETEEKIQMRLAKAEQELSSAPNFDLTLENNDLDQAVDQAKNWVLEFVNKRTDS